MTDIAKNKKHLSPYFMMEHARALQRVAQELEEDSPSLASDPDLFSGRFRAVPILLSLATEVALKAWLCREGKEPVRSHDLFCLFCELEPATQKRLEEALPSIPSITPALLSDDFTDTPPFHHQGLPDILRTYRKAFEEWRYRYEDPWGTFATSRITEALAVIIDEYSKPA